MVPPRGIEPLSTAPEAAALSVELGGPKEIHSSRKEVGLARTLRVPGRMTIDPRSYKTNGRREIRTFDSTLSYSSVEWEESNQQPAESK